MSVIQRVLRNSIGRDRLQKYGLTNDFSVVLITPTFFTSRHVVALVLDERGIERLVVKVPRRQGDDSAVRREADVLTRLLPRAAELGVPEVVGLVESEGRAFLVETALRGRPLDPEQVCRDVDRAVAAGVSFVARLPRTAEPVRSDWYAESLAEPLDVLAVAAGPRSGIDELAARTAAALEPLRNAALPRVLQHGDLSHPNLLLDERGGVRAIDWERADPDGLPGLDLVFLLTYLAESRRRAFERPAQLAAFDEAFWSPGAWARPVLASYLEQQGVDRGLLPLIVLACWARSSGTLGERLGCASEFSSARVELRLALQHDRDVDLWRRSLEHVERLRDTASVGDLVGRTSR